MTFNLSYVLLQTKESKEDKTTGPDASDIADLASGLQEASQGANKAPANKAFPFLNHVDGKEQISEALNEEQLARVGATGGGFCAAVSLNDGEY